MSTKLSTSEIDYIKRHTEKGQKSPEIAKAIDKSVWTVRKYVRLLKKREI